MAKAKQKSVRDLRKSLGQNQVTFWSDLGVTQSGGSRYENGRRIQKPVLLLLKQKYGWEPK